MTQSLYSNGCWQQPLQEAGLHPESTAVNGKTPVYFSKPWIRSLESSLGGEVRSWAEQCNNNTSTELHSFHFTERIPVRALSIQSSTHCPGKAGTKRYFFSVRLSNAYLQCDIFVHLSLTWWWILVLVPDLRGCSDWTNI